MRICDVSRTDPVTHVVRLAVVPVEEWDKRPQVERDRPEVPAEPAATFEVGKAAAEAIKAQDWKALAGLLPRTRAPRASSGTAKPRGAAKAAATTATAQTTRSTTPEGDPQ